MKKRVQWSDKDNEYLLNAYSSGVRTTEIIKHLKHYNCGQVYEQIRNFGLKQRGRGTNQPNTIVWTEKDITFIKENFHKMTNAQLAKALGRKITKVRDKCRELNLSHIELEYWTPEQVEYLKSNYQTKGDVELAQIFEKKWPKKKTWSKRHITKKRGYLKLNRTVEQVFTIRTGRFDADQYEGFNGKFFHESSKRLWSQNGKYYWMIKIEDTFIPLHRYNWEKEYGPIPQNKKLFFKDGDTTNPLVSNLELLTKSQFAKRMATKVHRELSDSYIAGMLSRGNPEMKPLILNHPGIINAKRTQIIENRKGRKIPM